MQNLKSSYCVFDQRITGESFACNRCYVFCQRLLQQYDEELCPLEAIVHAFITKSG